MFEVLKSRALRLTMLMLAAGLLISMAGCKSWSKHKKVTGEEGAATAITPPPPSDLGTGEIPASAPLNRPQVEELQPFDPETTGVNDVHFDYDKSDIRPDQVAILDANLKYFKANPDVRIMIEGHCDERGTEEYNFSLGQRRAASVQDYLLRNGVAPERLATISRGEANPVDPGHTESAWVKNRRARFMRIVR